MATIPQKTLVPTAIKKIRQKFDLSGDNITTSDFFRLKASKVLEVVPGDHFNISTESLIRMFPLTKPMFGRVNHYTRWFWVPSRTLCQGWNEFISQTPFYRKDNGNAVLLTEVPYFTNREIVNMYISSIDESSPEYGWFCKVTQSSVDAVIFNTSNPNGINVKFTAEGRAFLDLLQNLGYNINWTTLDETKMSALPLLAYFRVFADYYCSPQYLMELLPLFNVLPGESLINNSQLFTQLVYEYCHGFSNYDNDYFVSAWDNPISPNVLQSNPSISISDVTIPSIADSNKSKVSETVSFNGTPLIRRGDGLNGDVKNLSQYILNALRATTSYCIRNNIAGYKFWDRLKAEYNVNLDYKQKGTSLYIDTFETNLQIGEVMSNADTDGAALGDYAGRGIGYDKGKSFSFEPEDEFGYLIAVSSLVPHIDYYQGTDRINLHINRLDFFTPEYDQLGVQPISIREIASSQFFGPSLTELGSEYQLDPAFDPDKIFGYTPRYSEYKVGKSTLSGDFRLISRNSNGALNAYHLLRTVYNEFDSDLDQDSSGIVHNLNFVQGKNDQYDRIFAVTDPEYDHFYCIHHHEIHCERNMKSLAQTIFDDEEFEHNEKTEIPYNGSQFN